MTKAIGKAIKCRCPCGTSAIALERMPSVRFFCHCTICQSLYPGDYADATVTLDSNVTILTPDTITFNQYKEPPALDRGTCTECSHPVIGFIDGPKGKKFAFVPSTVLENAGPLPRPLRHVYYATRVRDIDDSLPKTNGPKMSQLMLTWPILKVALGK